MNIISENKYSYDANYLAGYTDPEGKSWGYGYDSQYRLTDTTAPLTHTTHFTYDSEHHLTQTRDVLGNIVSATYYGNGLSNTATDARSVTTTLTYDAYGNPYTAQTAGHPAVTYAYTPSDKLERITYPNSSYVQLNYNRLDNLTSMQDASGTTGFAYDGANRLISMTDPRNFAVSYQYDAAGNVTRLTYPGNKAVTYAYDALNRLKTVTNWLNQTATYNYDEAGRLTDFTNFNDTLTAYGYDSANRLTTLDNKTSASSVISNYQFTLDGNGNRTGVAQNEPLAPTLPTGETSYTYNNKKNRLLSAAANNFAYDNEGRISAAGTHQQATAGNMRDMFNVRIHHRTK